MRSLALLVLVFGFGCAHTPAPTESAAYQRAVDQAFADLHSRSVDRSPSSEDARLTTAAAQRFSKTQYFEVVAYPKMTSFPARDRDPGLRMKLGQPVTFQYRIDRQGHCALGADVVAEQDRANCVQIEIHPTASTTHVNQYVRVFMTPDYRVYGVSYHDVNDKGEVKSRRKLVKWDLAEPLSSDLLALSKGFVPLDLPIHATNNVRVASSQITLKSGNRSGQTCSGYKIRYHNTYGSSVKADWCDSDPWPTVVETDRYVAVLNTKAGG